MEKYNKRVPGRISGVLPILLGGLGMAYKNPSGMDGYSADAGVSERRTSGTCTDADGFYGKRCMSGDFVSDFADMGEFVRLGAIRFYRFKSLSEIVRSWLLRNLQKSFIHQRRKSAVN